MVMRVTCAGSAAKARAVHTPVIPRETGPVTRRAGIGHSAAVEEISLAFFRSKHYFVQAQTGTILIPLPGMSEDMATLGAEKVTRDELFERWPAWKRRFDELGERA